MADAFKESRNLFILSTNYVKPLSFEEWKNIPRSHMSAVLFVQFYEEITLAWYKVKSEYTPEENGVSTVCQYLEKNVPIILDQPQRFSSEYIYKVAYNCLYCICHDIKRDRERWQNEMSNIYETDEGEVNLFDTVPSASPEDCYFTNTNREAFWKIINEGGPEALKVVNHLLRGDSLGKIRKSKNSELDLLADVEVSVERMQEILDDLKVKLAGFRGLEF